MSVELADNNNNNAPQFFSIEEYFKMDTKDIQTLFENELGIKFSPGSNFILCSFNTDTNERIIFFDGALPLHEFIYYIPEFFNDFMLENNSNKKYIFSIIKETQYVNLVTTDGAETLDKRKENLKDFTKTLINIIDRTYGLYLNEHHKKKNTYRTDTTLKTFDTSLNHYLKNVRPVLLSFR